MKNILKISTLILIFIINIVYSKHWTVKLSARDDNGNNDNYNYLTIYDDASDNYDNYDVLEAPAPITPPIWLYFEHNDWGYNCGLYCVDAKNSHFIEKEWIFTIEADSVNKNITIKWSLLSNIDSTYSFTLTNLDSIDYQINMRSDTIYNFVNNNLKTNFKITVTYSNTAPTIYNATVSPDSGTIDTTFTYKIYYKDINNDPATQVNLYIDNEFYTNLSQTTDVDSLGGRLFTANITGLSYKTNHSYKFSATDGYDYANGDTILHLGPVVVNSPPTPPMIKLLPENPHSDDTLKCQIIQQSTDPDNDSIQYKISWFVNNTLLPDTALFLTPDKFTYNDTITCNIQAWDGFAVSENISKITSIIPYKPVLSNINVTPDSGYIETTFTFSAIYFNQDNISPLKTILILDNIEYSMQSSKTTSTTITLTNSINNLHIGNHYFYIMTSTEYDTVYSDTINYPIVVNRPPQCQIISPTPNQWYNKIISIITHSFDNDNNLNKKICKYSLNSTNGTNGIWNSITEINNSFANYDTITWNTQNLTTYNNVYLKFVVIDSLSDSCAQFIKIKIDNEPPNTEVESYTNTWHNQDFNITLHSYDTGIGVSSSKIFYKIGEDTTLYNVYQNGYPRITTESADNQIRYYAIDNIGNYETEHLLSNIKLDKTLPIFYSQYTYPDSLDNHIENAVKIYCSGYDELSGLKNILLQYKFNQAEWSNQIPMTQINSVNYFYQLIPENGWANYGNDTLYYKFILVDNAENDYTTNIFSKKITSFPFSPTIQDIPIQNITSYSTTTINLNTYLIDHDTPSSQISWYIITQPMKLQTTLLDSFLQIVDTLHQEYDDSLQIRAMDNTGLSDTANIYFHIQNNFIITYYPSNDTIQIAEGDSIDFYVSIDTNMQKQNFSYLWNYDSINVSTDSFYQFVANYQSYGQHNLTVQVKNDTFNIGFKKWVIDISNTNRPPQIIFLDTINVIENQYFTSEIQVVDPDSDATYIFFNNLPNWLNYDTGTLFGTPTITDSNTIFQIIASDSELTDTANIMVNIFHPNHPPIIISHTPDSLYLIINECDSIYFSAHAIDYDNDSLSFKWYKNNNLISADTSFIFYTDYHSAGEHNILLNVSDYDTTIQLNWSIFVKNKPQSYLLAEPNPINMISYSPDSTQLITCKITNNNIDTITIDTMKWQKNVNFAYSDINFPYILQPFNEKQFSIKFNLSKIDTMIFNFNDTLEIYSNAINDTFKLAVNMTYLDTLHPAITLSSTEINFSPIYLGGTQESNFSIYNIGNTNLRIDSFVVDSNFSFTPNPNNQIIQPQDSIEFTILFHATQNGTHTDTLTILSNSTTKKIALHTTVYNNFSWITITPDSINFGNVLPNITYNKNIVVKNTGSEALSLYAYDIPQYFDINTSKIPQFPIIIEPDDSIYMTVSFNSNENGFFDDTLLIYNTSENMPEYPLHILASITQPEIELTPSHINFGEILSGNYYEKDFIIKNIGLDTLTVYQIELPSANFTLSNYDTTSYSDINPNDSMVIKLIYQPDNSDTSFTNLPIIIHNNAADTSLIISATIIHPQQVKLNGLIYSNYIQLQINEINTKNLIGFKIYKKINNGELDSLTTLTNSNLTYNDFYITFNTEYRYYVSDIYNIGESIIIDSLYIALPDSGIIPPPKLLSAIGNDYNGITINWKNPEHFYINSIKIFIKNNTTLTIDSVTIATQNTITEWFHTIEENQLENIYTYWLKGINDNMISTLPSDSLNATALSPTGILVLNLSDTNPIYDDLLTLDISPTIKSTSWELSIYPSLNNLDLLIISFNSLINNEIIKLKKSFPKLINYLFNSHKCYIESEYFPTFISADTTQSIFNILDLSSINTIYYEDTLSFLGSANNFLSGENFAYCNSDQISYFQGNFSPLLEYNNQVIAFTTTDNSLVCSGINYGNIISDRIRYLHGILNYFNINVEINSDDIESNYLFQNYPNPFNPITQIKYTIKKQSQIRLSIYNIHGERIITLVNKYQKKGTYSIIWNGKNDNEQFVSSGIYFVILQIDNQIETRKMILLK